MNTIEKIMRGYLIGAFCDSEQYLTRTAPTCREKLQELQTAALLEEAQLAAAAVTLMQANETAIEMRRVIERQRIKETKTYMS